jgi:hypothetical protein
MNDLDAALRRLSEEPGPCRLGGVEAEVLRRVAGHSFARESLRFRVLAVGVALVMGIAGGALPERPASARGALSPLNEAAGLAPSTLLTSAP